jgi:tetratricopeptide (TPR) repeat protein
MIADYDLQATEALGRSLRKDVPKCLKAMEWLFEAAPMAYGAVAAWFIEDGVPAQHIAPLLEAYRVNGTNRVSVASRMPWLAQYYLDQNNPDEARKVADECAAVFSHAGLTLAGYVYETLGELDKAQSLYTSVKERYARSEPLLGFYLRHRTARGDYDKAAAELEKQLFPAGLQRANLENLSGPPRQGAIVMTGQFNIQRSGLKLDNVIVALGGYQVRTAKEAKSLALLLHSLQDTELIVWDGENYTKLTPNTHEINMSHVVLKDYMMP